MHIRQTFVESKTKDVTLPSVPLTLSNPINIKATPIRLEDKKPLGYYHIIQERNLFPPPQVKKEEDPTLKKRLDMGDSLPKTPLQLQLKGTVVGLDPSYSWAVIENMTTRKQDLYKVGDVVSGAQIIEIYRNRVILKREGKEEILMVFEEDKIAKLAGQEPVQSLPSGQSPPGPAPPGVNGPEGGSARGAPTKVGENQWAFSKDDVNSAINNANEILSQINIAPYFEEGAARGYKVENIQEGSLINQAGFKSGDIVKRVNGMPIETPDQLIQAYQKLKDTTNIQVEVERDGRTITLDYQIK